MKMAYSKAKPATKAKGRQRPSGDDVLALRTEAGLTQQSFAELLGVSIDTVRNWEQSRTVMHAMTWEYARLLVSSDAVRKARAALYS